MSKKNQLLAVGLLCLSASLAEALPSQIYFTNSTDLALNATVAGRPGKPIAAQVNHYGVPYMAVYVACQYTGKQKSCPIEFTDQKTGAQVATVTINADQARVITAPVLFGEYAEKYQVTGWENSPVDHIFISYK
jgi:hypothetical protein